MKFHISQGCSLSLFLLAIFMGRWSSSQSHHSEKRRVLAINLIVYVLHRQQHQSGSDTVENNPQDALHRSSDIENDHQMMLTPCGTAEHLNTSGNQSLIIITFNFLYHTIPSLHSLCNTSQKKTILTARTMSIKTRPTNWKSKNNINFTHGKNVIINYITM